MSGGFLGFGECAGKAIAATEDLPALFRTNEAKVDWINAINGFAGCAIELIVAGEVGELFEVFLFAGAAVGLHFAELLERLGEAARDALFVDGEGFEGVRGVADGFGDGERGVGFGVAGFPEIAVFGVADAEEVVLGSGDAVEAELQVGSGIGELGFDEADGVHVFNISCSEFVIGGEFFLGEMEGLGEETVAGGVEGGAFLALGGFGAGRLLGVEAIGTAAGVADGGGRFGGPAQRAAPPHKKHVFHHLRCSVGSLRLASARGSVRSRGRERAVANHFTLSSFAIQTTPLPPPPTH